jgi:hypothetical protein
MEEFLFSDMALCTADGTAHSNHSKTLKCHWPHYISSVHKLTYYTIMSITGGMSKQK